MKILTKRGIGGSGRRKELVRAEGTCWFVGAGDIGADSVEVSPLGEPSRFRVNSSLVLLVFDVGGCCSALASEGNSFVKYCSEWRRSVVVVLPGGDGEVRWVWIGSEFGCEAEIDSDRSLLLAFEDWISRSLLSLLLVQLSPPPPPPGLVELLEEVCCCSVTASPVVGLTLSALFASLELGLLTGGGRRRPAPTLPTLCRPGFGALTKRGTKNN